MRERLWKVKAKVVVSWVWRSMLHGKELLKDNGRWNIGSGLEIEMTKDYWLASREKAVTK